MLSYELKGLMNPYSFKRNPFNKNDIIYIIWSLNNRLNKIEIKFYNLDKVYKSSGPITFLLNFTDSRFISLKLTNFKGLTFLPFIIFL